MPPQPKALRQPLASPCLNISIPAIPLPSSPAAAICWQLRLICQAPCSELTPSQIRRCLPRSFSRVSLHSPHRPNRFALFLANAAAPAATRGYFLLQEIPTDRKSTRLNSSHPSISYAVFCLK